jgi:hypothetical protein
LAPAVQIDYEIRAKNMKGVRNGNLLVRFKTLSVADARDEVEGTLGFDRIRDFEGPPGDSE